MLKDTMEKFKKFIPNMTYNISINRLNGKL